MGKAKRQLNEARKEAFKEITRKYNQEPDTVHYHDTHEDDRNDNTRLVDLAYDIRQALFEHVNETACPLCEYLDIDNMINYVEWVLGSHL
jgi:hypothetical protein